MPLGMAVPCSEVPSGRTLHTIRDGVCAYRCARPQTCCARKRKLVEYGSIADPEGIVEVGALNVVSLSTEESARLSNYSIAGSMCSCVFPCDIERPRGRSIVGVETKHLLYLRDAVLPLVQAAKRQPVIEADPTCRGVKV